MLNMHREDKVMEVLDDEDEDEADKDLTNPQWSAIIVINLGISSGMFKPKEGGKLCRN